MHDYGGMAPPLACVAVLLCVAGLALFTTLAAAMTRWLAACHLQNFSNYRWQLLVAAIWASCWTLSEWLRGTLFTGLPWLNIGYAHRSEEHTSELQSLMRTSYAVFCLKKKTTYILKHEANYK